MTIHSLLEALIVSICLTGILVSLPLLFTPNHSKRKK